LLHAALIVGQLAVVIEIEIFERFRRRLQFFGRQVPALVRVESGENFGRTRHRRPSLTLTAALTLAFPLTLTFPLALAFSLTLTLATTLAATSLPGRFRSQFLGTETTVAVFIEFEKGPGGRADFRARQFPITIAVESGCDGVGRGTLGRTLGHDGQ
jgi:hypothetical protein